MLVLGVRFANESNEVALVQPASVAERLGIKSGDKITAINPGGAVVGPADYDKVTSALELSDLRSVAVERSGVALTLAWDSRLSSQYGDLAPSSDDSPLSTMDGIVVTAGVLVVASAVGGGILGAVSMQTPAGFILGAAGGALAGFPLLLIVRSLREVVRVLGRQGRK